MYSAAISSSSSHFCSSSDDMQTNQDTFACKGWSYRQAWCLRSSSFVGRSPTGAARRLHGHDDAAIIVATTNISRFSSVCGRVEKANGMPVIQAIELDIYTLRTLRSDESAGYIALVRTSDRISDLSVRDTEGDDLLSAEIHMDGSEDFFMSIPNDDFSD